MYLGVKKPVAFYKPRLKSSTIRRIVYTLYTLLVLVIVMISFSMIDLLHYNVYGTHILPLNLVITPMLILIIGSVVYMIV